MQLGLAAIASLNCSIIFSGAQPENCGLRSTPSDSAASFGAGLTRERRAVAGVAAHLHIHHQALADRIGRGRSRGGQRRHGDARQKQLRKTHSVSPFPFGSASGDGPLLFVAIRRHGRPPNLRNEPQPGEERVPALGFVDIHVEDDRR